MKNMFCNLKFFNIMLIGRLIFDWTTNKLLFCDFVTICIPHPMSPNIFISFSDVQINRSKNKLCETNPNINRPIFLNPKMHNALGQCIE